jgi:Zn-finger protein
MYEIFEVEHARNLSPYGDLRTYFVLGESCFLFGTNLTRIYCAKLFHNNHALLMSLRARSSLSFPAFIVYNHNHNSLVAACCAAICSASSFPCHLAGDVCCADWSGAVKRNSASSFPCHLAGDVCRADWSGAVKRNSASSFPCHLAGDVCHAVASSSTIQYVVSHDIEWRQWKVEEARTDFDLSVNCFEPWDQITPGLWLYQLQSVSAQKMPQKRSRRAYYRLVGNKRRTQPKNLSY